MRLEEEAFTKAAVVAKSKRFVWLLVNRDRTPEIPKRFNVSAYPTLLTLGAKLEKVHRFQGFKKEAEVLALLDDALARHALYLRGEEWDTPAPRPAKLCEGPRIATFPAPSADVPAGMTVLGDDLWIGQIGKLHRVDRASGEVRATYDLPPSVIDLTSDGKRLYAVESGWTAGKPIHVIDPATGRTERTLVSEENVRNKAHGAKGIAWSGGELLVLEGMRGVIHRVDPRTGALRGRVETPKRWLAGLDVEDGRLICGSRTHLYRFDATTGKLLSELAVNYPLRSVAAGGGVTFVMEQPVFGHGKQHERVQVWPQKTQVYRLSDPAGAGADSEPRPAPDGK